MTTAPTAVPLWNSELPNDRSSGRSTALVVRMPHGQFPASNSPSPTRQASSHQNPVAYPVSTPAADHPSTTSGYTHRTLTRSTMNPVRIAPTANEKENPLSSQPYCWSLMCSAVWMRTAIWLSEMRSI